MTAISADSASEGPLPATPPSADLAPIRLPGSDRTCEHREFLRGLGLRWDPIGHAWHGQLPPTARRDLETRFGLVPRVVRPIESFQAVEPATRDEPPRPPRPSPSSLAQMRPLRRDSSRTRFESRLALGGEDDDEADEPADPANETRRFSWFETTSGLPDDSREADERREEHYLRDARARVKLARAVVSRMPGLDAMLRERPDRAARFCARFAITEAQFRHGVPGSPEPEFWEEVP